MQRLIICKHYLITSRVCFVRHRKEVVNQLRQIDDEDWHVFSSSVVQDDSMESEETDSSVHRYANEDLTRYKDRVAIVVASVLIGYVYMMCNSKL